MMDDSKDSTQSNLSPEQEKKHFISPEIENTRINQPLKESNESNDQTPMTNESGSTTPLNNPKTPNTPNNPPNPEVSKTMPTPKKVKKGISPLFFLFGLVALFIAFIVMLVLLVSQQNGSDLILNAFGLSSSQVKVFLSNIVNYSFLLLSLFFFLIGVIGIFRLAMADKTDSQLRKKSILMIILGFVPFGLVLTIWFFLVNMLGRIELTNNKVLAEILLIKPQSIQAIQAPTEITFSSENVVKALQQTGINPTLLKWDFDGDGNYDVETNDFEVSYLYQNRGNYPVALAVEVEGEEAPRVYSYPLSIEKAVFAANPLKGSAPLVVRFDASQLIPNQNDIRSLDWDFNEDGIYEVSGRSELRPEYTFDRIGTYKVQLRVISQSNLVQNYTQEIEVVKADQPQILAVIEATPGLEGESPFQVRFEGSESQSLKGKITRYEWDFGDGSALQSGRTVSHLFSQPGDYEVSLEVQDDLQQSTKTSVLVKVAGASLAPQAKIKVDAPLQNGELIGEVPFKVEFDASASTDSNDDIVDYEWKFDDLGNSSGEITEFTFEEIGTYEVVLTVTDAAGLSSKELLTVQVKRPQLKAVINAVPEEGSAPLTVRFDGSASSAFEGKIVTYEWDFGDGSAPTITGARISHRYEEVGQYTAQLKITTNLNETARVTQSIFVREVPLRSCFSASRKSGKAPLSITFDSQCSTGNVSRLEWDFGDGKSSTSRKVAHTFEDPGSYNVTLIVFDDKNNISEFSEVVQVESAR